MLFPILGQAVYPLWWSNLTKDLQAEQLLCWSGMTDTEHTTSGSNEEEHERQFLHHSSSTFSSSAQVCF